MNFDPNQFLEAETTQASTRRPPLPPGDYTALISSLEAKPWDTAKGSGMRFAVKLAVEITPTLQQQLGLSSSQLTLSDSIMLDVNDAGQLDYGPGKNGRLRAYREAANMNKPGEPFKPSKLVGQPIKVKIGHEIYNGEPTERVEGVARAM